MNKETFKYIVGIDDNKQLDNIMLLNGDQEPESGDWTELLKKWYSDTCVELKTYMDKYHAIKYQ